MAWPGEGKWNRLKWLQDIHLMIAQPEVITTGLDSIMQKTVRQMVRNELNQDLGQINDTLDDIRDHLDN